MDGYDSDVFDAEVVVERSGCAFFDKDDLSALLGLSPRSLSVIRARDKIPAPDHYRDPDGNTKAVPGGHRRAIWTREQVVQILAKRS